MEDFVGKTVGVAIGFVAFAFAISLGLRLHDAWVSRYQATATEHGSI